MENNNNSINNDIANFSDILKENQSIQPIMDIIEQIMALPEESLNATSIEVINGMIQGAFTESIKEASINEILEVFESEGYTRKAAQNSIDASKQAIAIAINELNPSPAKRALLDNIFESFYNIFEDALKQYHNYAIKLPIKLDKGAIIPTYAHDTDACADLYAPNDIIIPANSQSNMIYTGVHIALPEGWMAMIFPRSSIGAKTGLRLSNSVGIIDSEYRGAIGVVYDNFSNFDFEFKAGDRIAQMLIMPSYRFEAQKVDTLPTSERGEGGFGSSGK